MSTNNEDIPTQHVRQELCSTRPAYRDGRNPKAVKVYTINQESCYLMFQEVPGLGNTQELIKLCALHGAIEEYRLLDEFPTVDKFTDVVLVKFKRIQSARHAKKKLDDWSFYGGVLHVTYAPEYESVEDTREKLQDRRKAIAARLRIAGKDPNRKDISRSLENQQNEVDNRQKSSNQNELTKRIESRIPSLHSNHGNNSTKNNVTTGNSNNNNNIGHQQSSVCTDHYGNRVLLHQPQNTGSELHPVNHSLTQQNFYNNNQTPSTSSYSCHGNSVEQTLTIPPPPKREPFLNFSKFDKPEQKFDFARVPTANAPFPVNFDARKNQEGDFNSNVKNAGHEISKVSRVNLNENATTLGKQMSTLDSSTHEKPGILNHPKYHKIIENAGIKDEKIIVKEFKKTGTAPKFIPRQTLNVIKTKMEIKKDTALSDPLDKEIRKNAVVLGRTQGPVLVPEIYQKPEKTETEKAVDKSVSEIRKRISAFSSEQDDQRKRPKTQ